MWGISERKGYVMVTIYPMYACEANVSAATNVEGIFRLAGSEKRIKELRAIFDSPDRYGKGLNWTGYTVHDAANVLRRYLNQLPEPIVPLNLYYQFRAPLKGYTKQAVGDTEGPQAPDSFDVAKAITTYQNLITELPPLNRQLLLYILDLLAVFASKADENRMNSQNLAAIFQPGMLSHPDHDMAPPEYRLSQDVLIFLIENQDHFLIGMRGTAADEQTVQEVQNGGTPPPGTPNPSAKNNVRRSISNASAGADDVRKHGGLRRNVSVSSRHSRQSNGAPSPASPAYSTPTSGVHRSNTVPSKRSPALPSSRLQKNSGTSSPNNGPLLFTQSSTHRDLVSETASNQSSSVSGPSDPRAIAMGVSSLAPTSNPTSATSQERLLPDSERQPLTPTREKPGFFGRSPTTESEKKTPNKLRKKRIPESSNPSAQSSTHSLNGPSALSPSPLANPVQDARDVEYRPLEVIKSVSPDRSTAEASPSADTPRQSEAAKQLRQEHRPERLEPQKQRPEDSHHSSDQTLKPLVSPTSSLHSHSSFNDQSHSDMDHLDDVTMAEQKEKKSRWRMSRKRDEPQSYGANLTPRKGLGVDGNAAASSSSIGSSARPRKSFTGDSLPSESNLSTAHAQSSNESGSAHATEEKKGPLGWIKNKMREKREENREREAEKERNKSPPASLDRLTASFTSRGKSVDIKRDEHHPAPITEESSLRTATPQPSRQIQSQAQQQTQSNTQQPKVQAQQPQDHAQHTQVSTQQPQGHAQEPQVHTQQPQFQTPQPTSQEKSQIQLEPQGGVVQQQPESQSKPQETPQSQPEGQVHALSTPEQVQPQHQPETRLQDEAAPTSQTPITEEHKPKSS